MSGRLSRSFFFLLVCGLAMSPAFSSLRGQEKAKGPPPSLIKVAPVEAGQVIPQAEFIGTVFYQEVSDVAVEIEGLIDAIYFEDGQRVKKGQLLVELGSDILKKRLQATVASYEQLLSELQIARIEFQRREKLFKSKSISEQSYDENRFRVKGLEKRASSLQAEVERIEIELQKKMIRAPFDGIVIKREVDRGEWLSEGETVAVLAKDDMVDIVVELPERYLPYVHAGLSVKTTVNGRDFEGTIVAIVPRADITTRTFPVKIRTPNQGTLIEGMSARAVLPIGDRVKSLIVPRDAVISPFGQPVVFAVNDSQVRMIPVSIVGYDGLNVGLNSQNLQKDALVAVSGNERLRDGQKVTVQNAADFK
jgi:RND family efflux transporter MFP subunit